MPRKKEEIPVEPEKRQEEIENMELSLQSDSLEEKAKRELTPQMLKILKKIAYYVSKVGLTLKESCMLCDIEFDAFESDMKLHPIIGTVIRIKELEYKKGLLYTISQKARSGDDKLATWLLENRYPDEYGGKKKGDEDDSGGDFFLEAIRLVRKRGDSNSLINPEAGRAVVASKEHGVVRDAPLAKDLMPSDHNQRIAKILG